MLFGIYLDAANPDVMEEVYEFRVSYPADGLTSVSIAKVKWMHKLTIQLISQKKDNVEVMTAQTKKEIKKATQSMMRTLITLTQTLKSLPGMRNKFYYFVAFHLSPNYCSPDHRQITMRLYYYEDATPINYEPPFFRAHEDNSVMFDGPPIKVNVGHVLTPYHG